MGKVIAVDFDDVCAETFAAMIRVFNAKFGKSLKDIVTNWLFHTPGWGGPTNLSRLMELDGLWVDHEAYDLRPVDGLRDALDQLNERGWAVYIVTSRPAAQRVYVDDFFKALGIEVGPGGPLKGIHFTGPARPAVDADLPAAVKPAAGFTPFPTTVEEIVDEMERDAATLREYVYDWRHSVPGKAKLKAMHELGASVLVDDNSMFCVDVAKDPDVLVVCFGPKQYSDRLGDFEHAHCLLSGDEREARGLPLPFTPTPFGGNLVRAKSWPETIALLDSRGL